MLDIWGLNGVIGALVDAPGAAAVGVRERGRDIELFIVEVRYRVKPLLLPRDLAYAEGIRKPVLLYVLLSDCALL